QVPSEAGPVLRDVNGESGQYGGGNGIWRVASDLGRRLGMGDGTICQRKVADHGVAAADDKGICGSSADCKKRVLLKPEIQGWLTTVKRRNRV
ncbi:MAG: hypothetical protein WC684_11725, partial [Hyphomicrobium sp.]